MPVNGLDTTLRNLAALGQRLPGAADDFLWKEGEAILARSQQLVPRDTDDLANSGEVKRTGGNVSAGVGRQLLARDEGGRFAKGSVEVAYGKSGPAADYALTVHEHPSMHDPPSWRGKTVHFTTGGPKFLELAYRESVSGVWGRLAAHLRGQLR